ncbi:MAG TPA: folylpolyglutamate synthase/dihydrofolate synthase family protein, partial [Caulobacteraceae bacterium]
RVERLLAALGRPQDRLGPVIHVAGTNGKGSTVAFLRAIAEAARLKVHVLTSPHLVRFAERIRIAGTLISDAELSQRIDEVEAVNAGAPISFFEITTALAFHAFAQTSADLTIVEVGLGGRFDATNVFAAPAASVITPVDLDHLEWLGPELAKIAWEKAGIIKRGRPVFAGLQPPEALEVIEAEAAGLAAPLMLMGRDFDAWEERGRLMVQLPDRLLDLPPPALFGAHQFANAGLAAATILSLGDGRIDDEAVAGGMRTVSWPGRFQRLTKGPLAEQAKGADIWLDGAHNPHAARALAEACGRLQKDGRKLALIVGMLGRKDALGFFQVMANSLANVFTTGFSSPGATPAEDLAVAARAAGLQAEAADGVQAALAGALAGPGPAPHVVICGSLHFIGDILALSPDTWPS